MDVLASSCGELNYVSYQGLDVLVIPKGLRTSKICTIPAYDAHIRRPYEPHTVFILVVLGM